MDVLGLATLAVGGFTACAEFGSYAFVHPVIRRLPPEYHLQVEQGLLRTFGRVMPVLMTLTLTVGVANAVNSGGQGGPAGWRWASAGAYIAALTSTVIFNVPINLATGSTWPRAAGIRSTRRRTGRQSATGGSSSRACGPGCC